MIAVLGGLGAAGAWAASTICSSRSSRMLPPIVVVAWIMLVGLVIMVPLVAGDRVPASLHGRSLTWLAVSGGGNVGGLMLAYAGLRIGRVSLVAPLVSTEGAIAAAIAIAVGESVVPVVGVVLGVIVVGLVLASRPEAAARVDDRRRHLEAVVFAVCAAGVFGLSLYATARAGAALPSAWVVLSARLIGSVALALPLLATRRLALAHRAAPLVVIAGVCEVLGFYSFTWGARHSIAVASVLSSQFATLAAVAGYVLFGERLSRTQVTGVATVTVGVALLSVLRAG